MGSDPRHPRLIDDLGESRTALEKEVCRISMDKTNNFCRFYWRKVVLPLNSRAVSGVFSEVFVLVVATSLHLESRRQQLR